MARRYCSRTRRVVAPDRVGRVAGGEGGGEDAAVADRVPGTAAAGAVSRGVRGDEGDLGHRRRPVGPRRGGRGRGRRGCTGRASSPSRTARRGSRGRRRRGCGHSRTSPPSGQARVIAGITAAVVQPAACARWRSVRRGLRRRAWYLPSLSMESPESRLAWASQLCPPTIGAVRKPERAARPAAARAASVSREGGGGRGGVERVVEGGAPVGLDEDHQDVGAAQAREDGRGRRAGPGVAGGVGPEAGEFDAGVEGGDDVLGRDLGGAGVARQVAAARGVERRRRRGRRRRGARRRRVPRGGARPARRPVAHQARLPASTTAASSASAAASASGQPTAPLGEPPGGDDEVAVEHRVERAAEGGLGGEVGELEREGRGEEGGDGARATPPRAGAGRRRGRGRSSGSSSGKRRRPAGVRTPGWFGRMRSSATMAAAASDGQEGRRSRIETGIGETGIGEPGIGEPGIDVAGPAIGGAAGKGREEGLGLEPVRGGRRTGPRQARS